MISFALLLLSFNLLFCSNSVDDSLGDGSMSKDYYASDTTGNDDVSPVDGILDAGEEEKTYETATFDTAITYINSEGSSREVKVRIWYPLGFTGSSPVILVSHGGDGNTTGHTKFAHLVLNQLIARGLKRPMMIISDDFLV